MIAIVSKHKMWCMCWLIIMEFYRYKNVCVVSRGNEKNLFHDYSAHKPAAVTARQHAWLRNTICCNTLLPKLLNLLQQNSQQFSAPFRSRFSPIITIVESWQHVHLKDQVLSFKTNGHLWKSVKNWLEKLAKSNAISKHVLTGSCVEKPL